ncbi:hypothetical protein AY599_05755 [Leptolyngbya valderiana BDU 20041]|nr:hypothetical protein AY599_05755 [Leptolyngbya valderiana BDU 20041]
MKLGLFLLQIVTRSAITARQLPPVFLNKKMSLYSHIFMVIKKFRAKHIVFIKILTRLAKVFYSRSKEDGRAVSQN